MSAEVENATISYKHVCDKNGFCVVKIISETPQNIPNLQTSETPVPKVTPKIEEVKEPEPSEPVESTKKITSSRKKKKK